MRDGPVRGEAVAHNQEEGCKAYIKSILIIKQDYVHAIGMLVMFSTL
jgi:hypothetical protein